MASEIKTAYCIDCGMPIQAEFTSNQVEDCQNIEWILICDCRYWKVRDAKKSEMLSIYFRKWFDSEQRRLSRSAEGSEHFAPDDLKFHDETERLG